MATNKVYIGTELKLNVHIDKIDGLTMQDYDFTIDAYCSPKRTLNITKEDAIWQKDEQGTVTDKENCIVCIDTNQIGVGTLMIKVTAKIPDGDFSDSDSTRTEIAVINTGIEIVR